MGEDLCRTCGASWECEHHPDPERARLSYVAPNGQTLRERLQTRERKFTTTLSNLGKAYDSLRQAADQAAQSVARFGQQVGGRSG